MCNRYGNRGFGVRHEHFRRNFGGAHQGPTGGPGEFRVPVNIVKNDSSYELFIFAPDREKDDFKINVKDHELSISYAVKEQSESKNWIRHEFSKTSFERSFMINETIDIVAIWAEYINGILKISLPIIAGSEKPAQEIKIS